MKRAYPWDMAAMESGTLFILSQFGHVIACNYLAGPAP